VGLGSLLKKAPNLYGRDLSTVETEGELSSLQHLLFFSLPLSNKKGDIQ
jgi:hypothetical protein